jgi:hypothetical protein
MKHLLWIVMVGACVQGCATGGQPSQGVKWVVEGAQERERLEKSGFPQYSEGG